MNTCSLCGGKLDPFNESEIVCPWCGETDCWQSPDRGMGFDSDADFG